MFVKYFPDLWDDVTFDNISGRLLSKVKIIMAGMWFGQIPYLLLLICSAFLGLEISPNHIPAIILIPVI